MQVTPAANGCEECLALGVQWNEPSHVPPGRQMLLSNLRDLVRPESPGHPDQRRPEATMNQGNLSIDKTTNQNFL